eukprot:jgi/Chrpa1/25866/Chrysochromulina_OHIO_Genome00010745-RA
MSASSKTQSRNRPWSMLVRPPASFFQSSSAHWVASASSHSSMIALCSSRDTRTYEALSMVVRSGSTDWTEAIMHSHHICSFASTAGCARNFIRWAHAALVLSDSSPCIQ